MHVAIIHYRLLLRGGLETRLFSYIDWFLNRGDKVTVIVSKIDPSVQVPEGIELVQINLKKIPKPFRQTLFDKRVKKLLQQKQFDFSLSLGRTSGQDAVLAPGNHIGYLKALGRKARGLSDRLQIRLDRRAYQNSKLILAAAEMMKNEVIDYFDQPESKVKVLYPPLDTARFHVDLRSKRREFQEKYGFSPKKTSLLFVSTGHFRKGLPLLLELFQELDPEKFELWVAGTPFTPPENLPVFSLGYIKETEELYAAADFTIHPSVYEPYGQIVPESLACGTPVLVSEGVGAREIVGETEGIVVKGFELADWKNAVEAAGNQDFRISPTFALDKSLTLQQHMEKMLKICGKR